MNIRFQITITGYHIHTCCYRTYAYELARCLNLTGIAAYTEDELFVEVQGSAANVHQYIEWIRIGPIDCVITGFDCREIPAGNDNIFHVIGGILPAHTNERCFA